MSELEEKKQISVSQRKRLQMQDIAKLAGVSTSTVSRALNNSPLVNDTTKAKVRSLAQQLNYSIDIGAQNLRLKNNKTIAVVIPYDEKNPQHVTDPFFLTMLGHIADELTKLGYYMLVSRINAENLSLALEPYNTGRAMGIIMIGQWTRHDQLNELTANIPIVVWGAMIPDQNYVSIGSDNFQGGFLATEHLIKNRATKNIAFMGDKSLPEVYQRYLGYVSAHETYNLPVKESLCIPVPFSANTVANDILALVEKKIPVDGIFACSDLIAMSAIKSLQYLNISVPKQIAIVGYDDISLSAYYHPSITTIRQSIEDGAKKLVYSLLDILSEKETFSEQLPVSLVLRETG